MPLKPSKTKPSLAEIRLMAAKKEAKKRGKGIDPTRQRKSSRNGGAMKRRKKIELSGDERYAIQRFIQKIPISARTTTEKKLLTKVK
jgi:hypothetical protein